MKNVKCGVMGIGFFGEYHLRALMNIPFAEVVGICRRDEEKAREIAKKYNIKKYYTDYRELLADEEIEMVTITTTVELHMQMAIDALKAGKHVFLEKPMGNNVEECEKIIAESKNTDKFIMVGHVCRFDNVYAMVKKELEQKNIGKIFSIHAWRNLAKKFTDGPLTHMSSLFGDGIHDLDLVFWYTGSKPKSVYARTMKSRDNLPFEDIGWATFSLENGTIVVIESIWCLPNNHPSDMNAGMKIVGSEGVIDIDDTGLHHYMIVDSSTVKSPESFYWPEVRSNISGYLKEELAYFLNCISTNKKPDVITLEEAKNVVNALKTAEKSASENKVIFF
jgi:UDP-N-acetylglucosamine 3-dehydrogenase